MEYRTELSGRVEWRVNIPQGTSEILVPESGLVSRVCTRLERLIFAGLIFNIWRFLNKSWKLGVSEPNKVIHGIKVGMALSFVSLFYYTRPLYDGVGGNAMWAVMTVVVVFEYTVGATLCKCVNRATATFLAGSFGIGIHWVASQSGDKYEPIILQISVFLFAAAATFSRFIPSVKARFDYGSMIFILTFSLVSVSGYRVDKLFELAHQRLSTIAIGTSICIIITMLLCPVWAGDELHFLINCNLEKLANSLDGRVAVYFKDDGCMNAIDEDNEKKLLGFKCVLNSKATEESLANFARWELAHGSFNSGHPWKQYLTIGASMRSCAYCIETLNGCINSESQAPEYLKKHWKEVCMGLSSYSSNVLKELAAMLKTMTQSSNIQSSVKEMKLAAQELRKALRSVPNPLPATKASNNKETEQPTKPSPLLLKEVLSVATIASLLIEITTRIEGIVKAVEELAATAEFRPENDDNSKQIIKHSTDRPMTEKQDDRTMKKTLQKV